MNILFIVYKNYMQFVKYTLLGEIGIFQILSFTLSNCINNDGKFKSYLKIRIKS